MENLVMNSATNKNSSDKITPEKKFTMETLTLSLKEAYMAGSKALSNFGSKLSYKSTFHDGLMSDIVNQSINRSSLDEMIQMVTNSLDISHISIFTANDACDTITVYCMWKLMKDLFKQSDAYTVSIGDKPFMQHIIKSAKIAALNNVDEVDQVSQKYLTDLEIGSFYCVPFTNRGKQFQVAFTKRQNHFWTEGECALLEMVAQIIAANHYTVIVGCNHKTPSNDLETSLQDSLFISKMHSLVTFSDNLDDSIRNIIKETASYLNLQRLFIYRYDNDKFLENIHYYKLGDEDDILPYDVAMIPTDKLPGLSQAVLGGEATACSMIQALPSSEREFFLKYNITSFYAAPISISYKLFFAATMEGECKIWTPREMELLKTILCIIDAAMVRDINEKSLQKSLQDACHLAFRDTALNIPNRLQFYKDMTTILLSGSSGAVVFFDIDDFKTVNDTYGHQSGDKLLKVFCDYIKTQHSTSGAIYRYGGDEFLFILDGASEEEARQFCIGLLDRFRLPWSFDCHNQYCTTSLGMVMYPRDGATPDELVKNSDIAMFRAKHDGKDSISHFNCDETIRLMGIEKYLSHAINDDFREFELYFQPIMNIATNVCTGAEALIRWNSAELGMVMPNEFLPYANYSGLIVPIGRWVLLNACAKCSEWINHYNSDFKININISNKQLLADGFVSSVQEVIHATSIAAGSIVLEITDPIDDRDIKAINRVLVKLRALGIYIAMNNIGTFMPQLSTLMDLDVDILKIDRSFIMKISEDKKKTSLVKHIIDLAHSSNLTAPVEGVETRRQYEILKNMGNITLAQGYYFAKPLQAVEFDAWYHSEKMEITQQK